MKVVTLDQVSDHAMRLVKRNPLPHVIDLIGTRESCFQNGSSDT